MYGFGGSPKFPNFYSGVALHCFPLNGNKNKPEVYNIQGIMETYEYSIANTEFSTPTIFSPIIRESMNVAKSFKCKGSCEYAILFILTDGEIEDMKETKISIVDSCYLPLSIIIVGVGDANFTKMHILDGDDGLYDEKVYFQSFLLFVILFKFINSK